MNPDQAVCNCALLQFIPYPQTGEVVNVGVVVSSMHPCFIDFRAEEQMPARVKALFPDFDEVKFAFLLKAMRQEVERISRQVRDAKACQIAFNELVRPRENILRFGEIRTILSEHPENLPEDLFRRYVRMEAASAPMVAEPLAKPLA